VRIECLQRRGSAELAEVGDREQATHLTRADDKHGQGTHHPMGEGFFGPLAPDS